MRAAQDNPEDARLRQAELEAARTGRERLMGARERAYESTAGHDLLSSPPNGSSSTRVPSRFLSRDEMILDETGIGASAAAALPRQSCRVHGCWRPQTSGHLVCRYHLSLGAL